MSKEATLSPKKNHSRIVNCQVFSLCSLRRSSLHDGARVHKWYHVMRKLWLCKKEAAIRGNKQTEIYRRW
ncbi:rCG56757 [Rattus norvegicus]|uniref:RCG56757 n=1 Tax=Rattus norvegicus TaxID=10116 RepID=A6KJI1_RAT|nr:rCG56757 [Rattus norvegicus]